ncbi:flagellar motor switch protein FliN [Hyphobacterium sp. HN65]|uniref:Flagellar motor switch protein FliN n=1 Tax=Hyphobacterium lacteum TaxID=3116575 RepID=A0ABU7LRZ9_9PROT|nr:flagellar motor switch protein FliN [Hyphobacterium sp. HN65]MEE2526109.1 flagellar motor switch protein FliN [Hyphobacterium sp. HN65]
MSEENDLELPDFDGQADAPGADVPAPAQAEAGAIAATLADEDEKSATDLAPVFDVPVNVSAVLGKTHIELNSLLKLKAGSVVELDRRVGEAIDIYVNDRLVARGEVVVVDDRLGVTMTEIIKDGDSA